MKTIEGRTAVVTGAGSGIGRALALELARRGARIMLVDIDEPGLAESRELVAAAGGNAEVSRTDVTDPAAMQRLADDTVAAFGAVHLLFNNAGVETGGPIETIPLEAWRWVLDVNFYGVLNGCRTFLPLLRQQEEGHIVNTASVMAFHAGVPTFAPYAVSKFAILAFSEALDIELRTSGTPIGVSLLAPAFVKTEMPNAERNAPQGIPRSEDNPFRAMVMEQVRTTVAESGLEAAEVARQALDAVLESRFYILPNPDEAIMSIEGRLAWMRENIPMQMPQ
ncbi:SDR family NAD(P)-dependent oxidoreductase [Nocardia sp. NPDC005366]|uniref:SDR family NAD(P)-dependent oxidoreductase n=1 Tax=Nocardia sp. NPDC005366 TaxID=3156878 RepID=UPI0033B34558